MVDTIDLPDRPNDSGTQYLANIDNTMAAHNAVAGAFHVSAQSSPNMTVQVSAGTLTYSGTVIEKSSQNTGTITAPSTNPRIDVVYLDSTTGVIGVTTGTEAASPAVPAISAGQIALAKITLATSTTSITSDEISDLRSFVTSGGSGGGSGGGGWATISTNTESAVTDIEIGLTSGYKIHKVYIPDLTIGADAKQLIAQLQTSGGSYRTGGSDYSWSKTAFDTTFSGQDNQGDADIPLTDSASSGLGSATNESASISLEVISSRNSSVYTVVRFEINYINANGNPTTHKGTGWVNTAEDNDKIRLRIDGATTLSGTVIVQGIVEA